MTPAADLAPANWAEESAGEFSDLEVKYACTTVYCFAKGEKTSKKKKKKKHSKLLLLVDSS